MCAEAGALAPLETGGMLLGYRVENEGVSEAVIEQILGPGPDALHGRTRFLPDGSWQRRQLTRIFLESGGTTTYLGDWHSHPCGSASPSPLDLKTARTIARSRRARTPHPLMAIVSSRNEGTWELTAHRYAAKRLDALALRRFDD